MLLVQHKQVMLRPISHAISFAYSYYTERINLNGKVNILHETRDLLLCYADRITFILETKSHGTCVHSEYSENHF